MNPRRHWRRWLTKLLWLLLAAALLAELVAGWKEWAAQREAELRQRNEEWLWTVILPRFELRETPISKIVAIFNQEIAAAPGCPPGFHIALATQEESARAFHRTMPDSLQEPWRVPKAEPAVPPSESIPAGTPGAPPQEEVAVTISLSTVSLREAFYEVTLLAGYEYVIESRRIVLHRRREEGSFLPLYTRKVYCPPGLIGRGLTSSSTEPVTRQWLRANGVQFYEDCFEEYNERTGWLTMRNTQRQLDLVETIAAPSMAPQPWWKRAYWWTREKLWPTPAPVYSPMPALPDSYPPQPGDAVRQPETPPTIPGLDPSQP